MVFLHFMQAAVWCAFACTGGSADVTGREGFAWSSFGNNWERGTGGKVVGTPAIWEQGSVVFGWAEGALETTGTALDSFILVALRLYDGMPLWSKVFEDDMAPSHRILPPVIAIVDGHCIVHVVLGSKLVAMNHSDPVQPVWDWGVADQDAYTVIAAPALWPVAGTSYPQLVVSLRVNKNKSQVVMLEAKPTSSSTYSVYQLWTQCLGLDAGVPTTAVFLDPDGSGQDVVALVVTNKVAWTLKVTTGDPRNRPLSLDGAPITSDPPATGLPDSPSFHLELAYFFTVDTKGVYWKYVVEGNGGVVSQEPILIFPNETDVVVSPGTTAADGGRVLYTISTNASSVIFGLDAQSGAVVWKTELPPNQTLSRPAMSPSGESAYVTANTNTTVTFVAMHEATGAVYKTMDVMSGCVDCTPVPRPYDFVVDSQGFAIVPTLNGSLMSFPAPTAGVPPEPPPPSDHAGNSIGYFAGAGGLLIVLLILCVPQWCSRKQKGKEKNRDAAVPAGTGRYGDKAGEKAKLLQNQQRPNADAESKYIALRKLGTGSFGTVYEVRCKRDGRLYALKRIPCDSEQERNEAVREWKMLCGINHPNKITAYETFVNWSAQNGNRQGGGDGFTIRRYVCIVMEYYPEGDLKQYIRSFPANDRPAEHVILEFGAQICSLLAVIHAQAPPLIHRDLKPENILLAENHTKVVVTDFGLARMVNRGSYLKTHAGTYAYISPETWDRHYSTGADIWALGCIMYAMASKRVGKTDCRCLWREASQVDFQEGIVREIADKYGYSEGVGSIAAQLLTPDRRRRPSALQALEWFAPHIADDDGVPYGAGEQAMPVAQDPPGVSVEDPPPTPGAESTATCEAPPAAF
eukprot:TRINITY_DN18458_c0_g1_i1.p1 TRINITY_DN18458_c0_g1~~TRINITY_DN18458_c0_g1_i1.p1  ORF type:complete len:859 (+),score=143.14 TRINITY_DN18458_c0_g1_i1:95-2671(+)